MKTYEEIRTEQDVIIQKMDRATKFMGVCVWVMGIIVVLMFINVVFGKKAEKI